jgi:hypothetical protein
MVQFAIERSRRTVQESRQKQPPTQTAQQRANQKLQRDQLAAW